MKTTAATVCGFEAVGQACSCERCQLWAASQAVTAPVVDINSIVLPMPKRAGKRGKLAL